MSLRRQSSFGARLIAAALASLIAWGPMAPAVRAQDVPAPVVETDVDLSEHVVEGSGVEIDERVPLEASEMDGEAPPDGEGEGTEPISLPGVEARTAVSPQAISLPTGEGSVEGMGESFSPVLSSGTATFTVPIRLAPGRAGVAPSLALSYSSSGGNGPVGFGWGLAAPFIARQTDRGLPRYQDGPRWSGQEDRFIYNGGQELVAVDDDAIAAVDELASGEVEVTVPTELATWQQYRARVEGSFMRFFRSPEMTRWVVQARDGTRYDFGVMPVSTGPSGIHDASWAAVEMDPQSTRTAPIIFRWNLTRMSDPHGSTIYYQYRQHENQSYLSEIYYVSPHSCGVAGDPDTTRNCSSPLSSYAARVRLVYETRGDVFDSFGSGWRVATAWRVKRIEVTSEADLEAGRTLLRRYHLRYDPSSFHSLLSEVQLEGRPDAIPSGATDFDVPVGDRTITEGSLGDAIVGRLLPPMRFGYSALPRTGTTVAGFGGVSSTVVPVDWSPPHSVDEARADLYDVNSDGLPDLVVTEPARYRTSSGEPAVGVFFNGFRGSGAAPAGRAAIFSGAVSTRVDPAFASTLSLSNPNVVPMDIDGDGRSDLLHMPRTRSYGWFTPTRAADPVGGLPFVSPADQGWRWTYARVDLPSTDFDPRIDLGRDSLAIQTLDVNNDHLIDVIRTTGTSMQTWVNLGWLPEGDGRFGSYSFASGGPRGSWALSTEPFTSCLPADGGRPIDFEDPEIRFGDMNGDGIQDIVRIRRGRIVYWPGRGEGVWGEGPIGCDRGLAITRYREMASAPWDLSPDLDGLHFSDVDADGTADLVQVRFDAVDVWFNRAGRSFTERITVRGTPPAPGFSPRVRFADIDGSGTTDIIWAVAHDWRYLDLAGGRRPRLLTTVENGLGAETTIEYGSSAQDYLEDLVDAVGCTSATCVRFTWGRVEGQPSERLQRRGGGSTFHGAGSPVVSTVVRGVSTTDHLERLGADPQVSETRYAYHEGYYEGIEQEFRGFGAADAEVVGDENNPTLFTRTWFMQGRRPQSIADDRLADSPEEALKGREFLTESFNAEGEYLSSSHATLASRDLLEGLDGRWVRYAYVREMNELRYDTTPFLPSTQVITLDDVRWESANGEQRLPARTRQVPVRGQGWARIRTTYDTVDTLGHVRRQTAWGRVGYVTGTPLVDQDEERIVSRTTPILVDAARWLWRSADSWIHGIDPTTGSDLSALGYTLTHFNASGDAVGSVETVTMPSSPTYLFANEPSSEGSAISVTHGVESIESTTTYDAWGQALMSCAGDYITTGLSDAPIPSTCLRFGRVTYETEYARFPVSESIAVGRDASDAPLYLTTSATYDTALGQVLTATDPNTQVTTAYYDGLGRPVALVPPPVGTTSGRPTVRIDYDIPVDARARPMSRVTATSELDDDSSYGEEGGSLIAHAYVDGLGRTRASLSTGDASGEWIRSGRTTLNRKGGVRIAYQPDVFTAGGPEGFGAVLRLPATPHTITYYDAFGRTLGVFAEDGSLTTTDYHALSSDVCDPLDNDTSSPFFHTCTTARVDGHGRVIDQIQRNAFPDNPATEIHRLWSWYRVDGVVTDLVRAQTTDELPRPLLSAVGSVSPHVHRVFYWDSSGRRVASDDPDTDDPDGTAGSNTWRYRFNSMGDIVAVRDPRGCGQNFFYDLAGRILGEQYVSCGEAQTGAAERPVEDVPGDAIGVAPLGATQTVDVRYFYDEVPFWAQGLVPTTTSYLAGRATGSSDRGQRSAVWYDARGNAVWGARQMAFISDELALTPGTRPSWDDRPLVTETAPTPGYVDYDDTHAYVRTAEFDHANRGVAIVLPLDPDFDSTGMITAPEVRGELTYQRRGLPESASVDIGATTQVIVESIAYTRDGLPSEVVLGDGTMSRDATVSTTQYDTRRRPVRMTTLRDYDTLASTPNFARVSLVADQELVWDAASNLTDIIDHRIPAEWRPGHQPQTVRSEHDALYRVIQADFEYGGNPANDDDPTDWRAEHERVRSGSADPMDSYPAPMLPSLPDDRVRSLTWSWDWLANTTQWTDDASSFYERSLENIVNGHEIGERPSALRAAWNLPDNPASPVDGGSGWLETEYGAGGNLLTLTARAQCTATAGASSCTFGTSGDTMRDWHELMSCRWVCASEQHFEYRWDELNRLAEARRWDRNGTITGATWILKARQRYRYDGANQRTIKQTLDTTTSAERIALYVYPGDFERRGLIRNLSTEYEPAGDRSETQYVVAGARLVWQHNPSDPEEDWARNRRVVVPIGDHVGTSSAALDVRTGEIVESSTYYPNGARETYRASDTNAQMAGAEPGGFTGKEADEEVGLTYFGQRYLVSRLGRWASPDPLHVFAAEGGEAQNAYHYVSGNLLQARDPLGLNGDTAVTISTVGGGVFVSAPLEPALMAAASFLGAVARTALVSAAVVLTAGAIIPTDSPIRPPTAPVPPPTPPPRPPPPRPPTERPPIGPMDLFLVSAVGQALVQGASQEQTQPTPASAPAAGGGGGGGGDDDDDDPCRRRRDRARARASRGSDATGRPRASPHYSRYATADMAPERAEGLLREGERPDHFREWNRDLIRQMDENPEFDAAMEEALPGVRASITARPTESPSGRGWSTTWHHEAGAPTRGQLIPRGQHRSSGAVQQTLHPGGRGGFREGRAQTVRDTQCPE